MTLEFANRPAKPLRPRDMRVLRDHSDGKPFRITSERVAWAVGILRLRGFVEGSSGGNYRITDAGRAALSADAGGRGDGAADRGGEGGRDG